MPLIQPFNRNRQPQQSVPINPRILRPRSTLCLVPGVNVPAHRITGLGREFHNSATSYYTANAPKGSRQKMTVVIAGRQTGAPAVANGRYFEIGGYVTGGGFSVEGDGANEKVIGWDGTYHVIGDCNWLDVDIGPLHGYVAVLDGSVVKLWRDGGLVYTGPITWTAADTGKIAIGADTNSGGSGSRSDNFGWSLFAVDVDTALPDNLAAAVSSTPWMLFNQPRSVFVSTSSSSLSASASGSAQASGLAALAASVAISAIGVATASGTAQAGVAVPLSAAGVSTASGIANDSVAVSISALGLAQAAGQAGLSASVLLAAAGAAQASGNATLAAQIRAIATGSAQASGTANLTANAPGALSATGSAVASGSAVLSVSVALQASGTAQASGSANLTGGAQGAIAATGSAQASGVATASVTVALTAAGFVQAMGAGRLDITVPLSAFGSAQASGTAALSMSSAAPNYLPGRTITGKHSARVVIAGAIVRRIAGTPQMRRIAGTAPIRVIKG